MTTAICVKCGATKFGALTPCVCGFIPDSRELVAQAMMLTDHYLSHEQLNEIGERIRSGMHVEFDPEQLRLYADSLGDIDYMIAELKRASEKMSSRLSRKPKQTG